MHVLVTGGAGFIGSHIVDRLISEGDRVTVLDNLHPQVHPTRKRPAYLHPRAQFIRGDVRDRKILGEILPKVDAVFHKAARVGVGQSMYEIEEYVDVNVRGTALLLELLSTRKHHVRKLVVASSMSIYGEGTYDCPVCGLRFDADRNIRDLKNGIYEPRCAQHRVRLKPRPTPECKPLVPTSIYASTKRDQEEMCLMIGKAYGIPTVALRYFNVYGPRQALSNPYTGVLAIFSARLLNNRAPVIFEDGRQTRDFVHVRDIAGANEMALRSSKADGMALNVGTGIPRSIGSIAGDLAKAMGKKISEKIMGEYRVGDIRHCVADTHLIRKTLGWKPGIRWEDGLEEYVGYIGIETAKDLVPRAISELGRHRLRRKTSGRG